MTLWPASDDVRFESAVPSSAFSRGDIVMYDSNSSLSRVNEEFASSLEVAGVAMSASDESIGDQVVYAVADDDTDFWADSAANSHFTPGEELDFEYDTSNDTNFYVATSVNTARCIITPMGGTNDVTGQSTRSRVKIRFMSAGGELENL